MATDPLHLDEETLNRAKRLAEARSCSVEELITKMLEQLERGPAAKDPFLGMLAAEPDVIDFVEDAAMNSREGHVLRQPGG